MLAEVTQIAKRTYKVVPVHLRAAYSLYQLAVRVTAFTSPFHGCIKHSLHSGDVHSRLEAELQSDDSALLPSPEDCKSLFKRR